MVVFCFENWYCAKKNTCAQSNNTIFHQFIYIEEGGSQIFFLSNDVKLKICSGLKISTLPALLTEMFGSML